MPEAYPPHVAPTSPSRSVSGRSGEFDRCLDVPLGDERARDQADLLGLLEQRPFIGGLILGLLTFKPQFCILVPIALLAAGQWRALLASGLSALALVIVSGLVFGLDLWLRWFPVIFENLVSPNEKWIEYGRMWGHSVYTCASLLGAPPRLASLIQLLAALGAAASVVIAFRSRLGMRSGWRRIARSGSSRWGRRPRAICITRT